MRLTKNSRLRAWLLAWAFAAQPLVAAEAPDPSEAPLTRVAEMRRLSREEAAKRPPVSVRGVCMWTSFGDFFLHDGTEGIWVAGNFQPVNGLAPRMWENGVLEVGAELEIKGLLSPGGYAPAIYLQEARRVGSRELPPAQRMPIERLIAGNADAQRVEVEGVVQETGLPWAGGVRLTMMVDGNRFGVAIKGDPAATTRWVDARVRVRGICAPDFNVRSQAVGGKIMVNGLEDIEVLSPAPSDPFAGPRVPLGQLMHFSPDADPSRRRLTEGTVIFAVPGEFFFLQDRETGVRVRTASREVRAGQRLAVAGFLDQHAMFAELGNAVTLRLGEVAIPAPIPTTAGQLLSTEKRSDWKRAIASDLNGRTVAVRGVLRRVDWSREGVPERVWAEAEGQLFHARFSLPQPMPRADAARWRPGAEAVFTGVAELEFSEKISLTSDYPATGFHLWLAAPGELRVVRLPPWWTPQRLALALGGTALAAAIFFAWGSLLRRQVARQTRIIGEKGRAEAAHAERTRIARDLHDEIGANLPHISILSTLAAQDSTGLSVSRQHSSEAALVARQTIQAFDEILWSVNPKNDTLQSLSHYLCRATEENLAPSGVGHHFELDESFPGLPLPPHCRQGLLLAVKEVLHNILKHAAASRVELQCTVADGAVFVVRVADDGRGFDPEAVPAGPRTRQGQGLENIRRRLAEIGGECRIESRPGHGTTVTFRLPLRELKIGP